MATKEYYNQNKERCRENAKLRNKRYRDKNIKKYRLKHKKRAFLKREDLTDVYVLQLLKEQFGKMKFTTEMIMIKRLQLKIKRLLREKKNDEKCK